MSNNDMTHQFCNKTVLVSGASSGIGAVAAKRLAAEGARVGLTARNVKALDQVAEEIHQAGGIAMRIPADLCSSDEVKRAVAHLVNECGTIDYLLHCAADATHQVFLSDQNENDWMHTIDVNLGGAFRLCRSVIGGMLHAGAGNIVLVSSVAGLRGIAANTSYCAAKHGMIGLARSLAMEVGQAGIRVNAVCPGLVDSPGTNDVDRYGKAFMASLKEHHGPENLTWERYLRRAVNSTAIRRLLRIDEVVDLALYLLSDQAQAITGQAIVIDGGMS